MPLGIDNPAWAALSRALAGLCNALGATHAAIFDESCLMWCAYFASPNASTEDLGERLEKDAMVVFERHVAPIKDQMRRGGSRLRVCRSGPALGDFYVVESFANIYVLAVWFAGRFPELPSIQHVRRELPRIEALTAALPPPDGPDADGAVAKRHA